VRDGRGAQVEGGLSDRHAKDDGRQEQIRPVTRLRLVGSDCRVTALHRPTRKQWSLSTLVELETERKTTPTHWVQRPHPCSSGRLLTDDSDCGLMTGGLPTPLRDLIRLAADSPPRSTSERRGCRVPSATPDQAPWPRAPGPRSYRLSEAACGWSACSA
jgi:hypothetical protein